MSALTQSEVIDGLYRLMLGRYGPWFAGRVRERMHEGFLSPGDVGWAVVADIDRRWTFWMRPALGTPVLALLVLVIEYVAEVDPPTSETLPGSVVLTWAFVVTTAAFAAVHRGTRQSERAIRLIHASGSWSRPPARVATAGPGSFVYGHAAILLDLETPQSVAEGAYMDERYRAERISTGIQSLVLGLSALGVATVLWAGIETASTWTWTWFLCTGAIGSAAVNVMWTFVVKRRRDDRLVGAVTDPSIWSGGPGKGYW